VSAQNWGNVATAGWVVAGIGVGIAITGFVLSRSSGSTAGQDKNAPAKAASVEPYVGIGSVGLHGSF
jgi:hypothetical protein